MAKSQTDCRVWQRPRLLIVSALAAEANRSVCAKQLYRRTIDLGIQGTAYDPRLYCEGRWDDAAL
jgi:hypothetical protein